MLKTLKDFFRRLFTPSLFTKGDEDYLAGATDHCDLERRMRALERSRLYGIQ